MFWHGLYASDRKSTLAKIHSEEENDGTIYKKRSPS